MCLIVAKRDRQIDRQTENKGRLSKLPQVLAGFLVLLKFCFVCFVLFLVCGVAVRGEGGWGWGWG